MAAVDNVHVNVLYTAGIATGTHITGVGVVCLHVTVVCLHCRSCEDLSSDPEMNLLLISCDTS